MYHWVILILLGLWPVLCFCPDSASHVPPNSICNSIYLVMCARILTRKSRDYLRFGMHRVLFFFLFSRFAFAASAPLSSFLNYSSCSLSLLPSPPLFSFFSFFFLCFLFLSRPGPPFSLCNGSSYSQQFSVPRRAPPITHCRPLPHLGPNY